MGNLDGLGGQVALAHVQIHSCECLPGLDDLPEEVHAMHRLSLVAAYHSHRLRWRLSGPPPEGAPNEKTLLAIVGSIFGHKDTVHQQCRVVTPVTLLRECASNLQQDVPVQTREEVEQRFFGFPAGQ